jgi:integrase
MKLSDGKKARAGETLVKNIPAPETGYSIFYDQHEKAPPGFGLRVTDKGTKSFILRYSVEGHDRRMTIGQYPTWSLTAARDKAKEYKREIDGGTDILEERRIERDKPTVAEAVDRFCKDHHDELKSGPASRSRLERFFVSEYGKRKLHTMRRPEIRATVRKVAGKHGRQAALLLTNLKGLFAWAEDEELIDANPVATLKPAKVAASLKPVQRKRVLDEDEIRAFWTAAETCGIHKLTALAMKLILVTGARPGEVAGAKWSEITGKTWTIPGQRRGKTGTDHIVPLTDTALALLNAAKAETDRLSKRRKHKGGDYVFPARPRQALRPDAIAKAVRRYHVALGSKNDSEWGFWTAHDLRRTMRTGLSAERVPMLVAELAIGHTKKGVIGIYDAHHYAPELREALEAWERRLLRIVAGKPGDDEKVTPIRREPRA